MKKFLFLMIGHDAFIVLAADKRAARALGLAELGYSDGMDTPRHNVVSIA